ncbi:hypothetical protein [Clostridium butyricum]|uniref:hypothetical protein n=1 Tax=Clostridium butyricum TaxID=1492 RepID=UPI002ABD477F|nr:hypothetical protein [Clostridium butyricum]
MTFEEISNVFGISMMALLNLKPLYRKSIVIDIVRMAITNKLETFRLKLDFEKGIGEFIE